MFLFSLTAGDEGFHLPVCEAFKAPVITWITGDKHTFLLLGGILMLDEILFSLLCILR